jgi:hypothetical protein
MQRQIFLTGLSLRDFSSSIIAARMHILGTAISACRKDWRRLLLWGGFAFYAGWILWWA